MTGTGEDAASTVGVALLGCGVVGTGVLRVLAENADLIARRTGKRFEVRHLVVRDLKKARDVPQAKSMGTVSVHSDIARAIADPKVGIVIELMGGTTHAAEAVIGALSAGKSVVTANKALLAARAPELFALARHKGVGIGFEASCAGGIPVLSALVHGLVANRIDAVVGIVNGTCNFILTQMTRNGQSYAGALAEAQKLGFAEADPTADVSGRDAAQKLALLASLAFDTRLGEQQISIEGIEGITASDIRFADELGYVIKLLAIGQRVGDSLSLRVAPTLVAKADVLAEVSGSFNAVSIYGSALGHCLFYGRGAGSLPTASAVVSDLVQVGIGVTATAIRSMSLFADTVPAKVLPIGQSQSRYYLRLIARDEPGVLASITRVLGDERISVASFLQHESADPAAVPLVITTHHAREGAVRTALQKIADLPAVTGPATCLRLLDTPREFAPIVLH
jgi:homoserine dehydrogenase